MGQEVLYEWSSVWEVTLEICSVEQQSLVRRSTFFGEGRSDYSIITVALMNVSCDAARCVA